MPEVRRFYDALNVRYYVDTTGAPDVPGLLRLGHFDMDVYRERHRVAACFLYGRGRIVRGRSVLSSRAYFTGRWPSVRGGGSRCPRGMRPELVGAGQRIQTTPRDDRRAIIPATEYRLTNNVTTFHVHASAPGVAALLEDDDGAGTIVSVNGQACRSVPAEPGIRGRVPAWRRAITW